MSFSIKSKILLASIASIGLIVGLIGFVLNAQRSLAESMNRMIENNMAAMRSAEQIKYSFVLYDDLVFRYLVTEDLMLLSESERAQRKVHSWIRLMKSLATGPTEQELLAEIKEETSRYESDVTRLVDTYRFNTESQKKSVLQLIKALETGGQTPSMSLRESQKKTMALLSAEGRARLVRIYSQCEKLVDIARSKLEEAQEKVRDSVERTERMAFLFGSIVVIGAALVAVLLGAALLAPLQNLLKGVQRVTAGELELELPVESSDEIGRLTHEFNGMTRNLREKQKRLLTETITDSLTGLHNFRYFQLHLKEEISRAARYKHPFVLLIMDIDHFKRYNDTNGHQMGNVLLKQIAVTFRETLRQEDFIARYGGEEFVIVLPETDRTHGTVAAERLRLAIEQGDFPLSKNQPQGKLTISVGGAVFPQDSFAGGQLVEKADQALYAAKRGGRNRVVWADAASFVKEPPKH